MWGFRFLFTGEFSTDLFCFNRGLRTASQANFSSRQVRLRSSSLFWSCKLKFAFFNSSIFILWAQNSYWVKLDFSFSSFSCVFNLVFSIFSFWISVSYSSSKSANLRLLSSRSATARLCFSQNCASCIFVDSVLRSGMNVVEEGRSGGSGLGRSLETNLSNILR